MIDPPYWSRDRLEHDRAAAVELFRKQRMEEPLEDYLEAFENSRDDVTDLLEQTVDLSALDDVAEDVLTNRQLLHAFRYLAAPPISDDDLKTVAEAASLAPSVLRADAELVQRIVRVVLMGLDRMRFPWVREGREPTEAEKHAAIIASAALMATQRANTNRRSQGKTVQEAAVAAALVSLGFRSVPVAKPKATIKTPMDAPQAGEFSGEQTLGPRKADFIVRLWDHRIMPIECKSSNSEINSLKRLNNDAAIKAEVWRKDFGATQVVPTAVLSGVYKLQHLVDAQKRGLTLFWAHDLGEMQSWITSTR